MELTEMEIKLIDAVRAKPELMDYAWQLVEEARLRIAAHRPAGNEQPRSS